jgi:hypothetical protein
MSTPRARSPIAGHLTVLAAAVVATDACSAQDDVAYRALFGDREQRLSPSEMQSIQTVMTMLFQLGDDGTRLVDSVCGDVEPAVEIVDLNDDGELEVFVAWGNACLSGSTGRSLSLFVKGPAGEYRHHLGFPALGYERLTQGVAGFPDLAFGGPGFCSAVWVWDGAGYRHECNRPDAPGGCALEDDVCPEE